jgi:hypothetical protein
MEQPSMTDNAQPAATETDLGRNRLEIIRFTSDEACSQAIGVLIDCGKLSVASYEPNVWNVRTDAVRALLAKNVPFEWLTRNLA